MQKRDFTTARNVTDLERRYNLSKIPEKVDKENGKGLSSNDFSDAFVNQIKANSEARHRHSNFILLSQITQEMLMKVEAIQEPIMLFKGESQNDIQLPEPSENFKSLLIKYGDEMNYDCKYLAVDVRQFCLKLNTGIDTEEKAIYKISNDIMQKINGSNAFFINEIIGFRKVDVSNDSN